MTDISKLFMIDIETTGLEPGASILQIAMLEMRPNGFLYAPGDCYEEILRYEGPVSDFGKKHQAALYERCRAYPIYRDVRNVRQEILDFIGKEAMFCGWNASNFDLPRLIARGYLQPGDYNYRVYEMSGAIYLAQNVFGCDRDLIIADMKSNATAYQTPIQRPSHDGIQDCYEQLNKLNGLIKTVRSLRGEGA